MSFCDSDSDNKYEFDMNDDDLSNTLSSMPPAPPELTRSLSHMDKALEKAKPYMAQCNEGDTIFCNHFTDSDGVMTIGYYQKKDGRFREYTITKHITKIQKNWTFYAIPFPKFIIENNKIVILQGLGPVVQDME